jgi:hypothetical protein
MPWRRIDPRANGSPGWLFVISLDQTPPCERIAKSSFAIRSGYADLGLGRSIRVFWQRRFGWRWRPVKPG